ncbi:MAG: spore maturation protein A [Oscillospiraceae bacterium]|nr:spore maturation protein A [Oscillospiraceae bacterium]
MAMTWILALYFSLSLLFGALTGTLPELSAAMTEGAASAVTLALSLAGIMSLWSGILEVLRRAGAMDALARLLRPVLRRLYPAFAENRQVLGDISANVSANLLGLGNAATPAGIRAARGMYDGSGNASDALCMLVICNTASIQLLPTTVAALRADAGAAAPFDILPAVWLSSGISVLVGILAAKLLSRIWR